MSFEEKFTSFKADWIDIGLIKISVFTVALLYAKLWKPILNLNWYWYFIIWVVAAIRPMVKWFKWLKS